MVTDSWDQETTNKTVLKTGAGINIDVCGDILSWFPALYSGRNDSNAAGQEVEIFPAFIFCT